MKKVIIGVVIVALIALFGGRAMYLHRQNAAEKDIIKIGALLPMSGGSVDFVGPWSYDSAKIAEEAINSSGAYNFKIKIISNSFKVNFLV